jgi:hypothetical protein
MFPSEFYLIPEDVYRLGNAEGPRLGHVRARDVDTTIVNGIAVVIANGKGISVFDLDAITHAPFNGWVWKLAATTPLPTGLKIVMTSLGTFASHP